MQTCSGYCNACRKAVSLLLKTVASRYIAPAVTTGLGGALGWRVGRGNPWLTLLGLGVGFGLSRITSAATPPAQKWVCGDCGCDGVTVT